jgi:hypothetical protein
MNIIIDCNYDKLVIDNNGQAIRFNIKNMAEFQTMVYEIINAVFQAKNVKLIKIDEDTSRTLEEW